MKFYSQLIPQLLSLFERRAQLGILGLVLLILLGAVFEMIGVALVFPFISVITQPELILSSSLISGTHMLLNEPEIGVFLSYIALVIVAFFLIKNLFLAGSAYLQLKFVTRQQIELSTRLFRAYMTRPYTFHLSQNTAGLLRNLSSEIPRVFANILVPGMQLIAEVAVVLLVGMLILIVEPVPSILAMSFLLLSSYAIYSFYRRRITREGEIRQHHYAKQLQQIQEALGGVKEIRMLGREEYFEKSYQHHLVPYVRSLQFLGFAQRIPPLVIESVVVAGLMLLIWVIAGREGNLSSVLPTLSLFAVAAFRLMPSTNRILTATSKIRFAVPALTVVHEDLEFVVHHDPEVVSAPEVSGDRIVLTRQITMENVHFKYPGASAPSLKGINLTLPKGEVVAFVGPSGAGKTTAVDLLLGLLTPTIGKVSVDGTDINTNLASWQSNIGYVPQTLFLSDDSVKRNIAFGVPISEISEERVRAAIEAAQLESWIASLPQGLETSVGERGVRISGGQRQRLGIARALYHEPEILVMDEATAELDSHTESEIMSAIDQLVGAKTVVFIAHRLGTIQKCTRLYFLQDGLLSDSGSFEDLVHRNSEFRTVAGLAKDIVFG